VPPAEGDHRWDKEALGGDQGGEGCCGGADCGCGTQGSARQGSRASQEGRAHCSGTEGAVYRNEETVGEKEGGGEEESGLTMPV